MADLNATGFTTSARILDLACVLAGYSIRETAAAAATVNFRDGSSTGTILHTVAIPASTSVTERLHTDRIRGVVAPTGLYVEVTGTVVGSALTEPF